MADSADPRAAQRVLDALALRLLAEYPGLARPHLPREASFAEVDLGSEPYGVQRRDHELWFRSRPRAGQVERSAVVSIWGRGPDLQVATRRPPGAYDYDEHVAEAARSRVAQVLADLGYLVAAPRAPSLAEIRRDVDAIVETAATPTHTSRGRRPRPR